ncbi:MAG TPA: helix-turn-helix transcriptional regulator [Ktedonobacterales bacterium]|nr:helix-turn-helix transcriptional regulator [Ktedonobacterales bacterium]
MGKAKTISNKRPYTTADYIAENMQDPVFAAVFTETRFEHSFADALWHARKRRGWSQRELAERAGMTQSALNRLEKAGVTPTITTVWYLVKALGCEAHLTKEEVTLIDLEAGE